MASISSIRNFSFSRAYDKISRKATRVALNVVGSSENLPTISNPKTLNAID